MKNKKQYIFFAMFLAYTSIYVARLNLSMAGSELIGSGYMDAAQLGFLGSIFSTVYSVGRLLNGSLSDTAPPWKMLAAGLAAAGVSNICISFFPPFIGIFLLWTANAYAQSMLWSSILRAVTILYDKETAKKKMSVMITSVAAGNILGIIVNTYLITRFGVRYAFLIPGAVTFVLAAVNLFAVRHVPNIRAEQESGGGMLRLLKEKELVKMCVPAMFHGVMKENISLWMTVYIIGKYSVDLGTSSYYILLIPVIGLLGRLIYPLLFSLCGREENSVSLLGFGVCIAASLILCFGRVPILGAVAALGVIYMAVSVINTSLLSIYPMRYMSVGSTASASGILDFATYLGAGVSSAIYGAVIKHIGYFPMFASWAVISAASMLIIIGTRREKENNDKSKNGG